MFFLLGVAAASVFSFRITDLKTQQTYPPPKKKLPHYKIYKAKEIKFVSVNKLWKTCKSSFNKLLSSHRLQQEEKELGLVLSSSFIFYFGGNLQCWENLLFLCEGFLASVRWKIVLFSFWSQCRAGWRVKSGGCASPGTPSTAQKVFNWSDQVKFQWK